MPDVAPAALRMACAVWCRHAVTTLTPEQQAWLEQRLRDEVPLSLAEVQRLTPELLAWANALSPALATVLRQVLGLEDRPVVERMRDVAYEAGRVRENTP